MNTLLNETSKFLSYILRHEPHTIGLHLDSEGWAVIHDLITCANNSGRSLNYELITQVVTTSDKKRFTISDDGLHIRAAQGHSNADVAIKYPESVPPEFLYHGTATRFLDSISKDGLKPGSRHYVHLSENEQTAIEVGQRYGVPVVLKVSAQKMYHEKFTFYLADNGVWLTNSVPINFIDNI